MNVNPADLVKAGVIQALPSSDQGEDRRPEDVKAILIRKASETRPDDKPANYRIKEDGTIEQIRNPDKKADSGDNQIVLELDDRAYHEAKSASEAQKAAIRQMINFITARYAAARMAPEIPSELYDALYKEPELPPPQLRPRSSGYNGGQLSGFGGGSMPSIHPTDRLPASQSYLRGQDFGHTSRSTQAEQQAFSRIGPSTEIPNTQAMKGFLDRVVAAVSGNEGGFTSINWNDNGHGISVGKAQWNQRSGELPTLLKRWHDQNPQKFKEIFGGYADQMEKNGFDVVRHWNITRGSDIGNRFGAALSDTEFQGVQTEMLREKCVKALELANKYGHHSELFVAQVADMGNQFGWGGVEACLRKANVANIRDERTAVQALQQSGQQRWARRAGRDAKLAQLFSPDQTAMA